tara:strand:+ start:1370 stop:1675 length:306 start_codon:yes stop_codon:yes gene_type:complete
MNKNQRGALHLWFSRLAPALNDSGFDVKDYFNVSQFQQPCPWTDYNVKEIMFKRIAAAMFGVDSSENLDSNQFNQVQQVMERNIAENTGVYIEFPSYEKGE